MLVHRPEYSYYRISNVDRLKNLIEKHVIGRDHGGFGSVPDELRKTMKNVRNIGVLVKIQTANLPKTHETRYSLRQTAGQVVVYQRRSGLHMVVQFYK
jgi:hypothetical protein